MRKLSTLLLAGAMTAAMAVPAFAGFAEAGDANASIDNGAFYYDLNAAGIDPSTVTGITITFTVDDSDGFGGGFMQCYKKADGSDAWVQQDGVWDWGNPDSDKAVKAEGADGSYTLTASFGEGAFEDVAAADSDGAYAKIAIQEWWGNDITVTSATVLTTGEAAPVEPDEPAEPDGDVAPIALLASVMAVAGLALVASKKRA